jgi:hypothetical protein
VIGRVVVTSVPRGLDGGTGFQTVLRTHGLSPAIAERLTIRASYSHPYGLGDARNPHVIFHRIETLAGKTIHVLGSVRDAGTSYTGRSNHLAELIAVDAAETGSLLGGPAFAARSFPWLSRWTGDPREVPRSEESTIPTRDSLDPEFTGRPSRCVAWERATGDAGWAGELAQSFLDGRRALLWAGHDVDILELFTEAARLLPASLRWQLTFNTCEIEPFPAHWRAVRPELGLVGKYEPKNELRLVIAKIRENRSRPEHDHALVRQARGELIAADRDAAATRATGPVADATSADARLRAELERIRASRVGRPHGDVAGTAHDGHSRSSWSIVASVFAALAVGALLLSAMAAAWVASNDPGFFNRVLSGGRNQVASINRHDELKPKQQETPNSREPATRETTEPQEPPGTPPGEASGPSQQEMKPNDDEEKPRKGKEQKTQALRTWTREAATAFNKKLAERPTMEVPLLKTVDTPLDFIEAKPVVLLDFNNFNPKILEHVTLVKLLDDLGFEIDIVGPHKDPLSIRRLDGLGSASSERSWEVLGKQHLSPVRENQFKIVEDNKPPTVCTITINADERKLLLYPNVKAGDPLFKQLQKSLVLISTRDLASESDPIVRQQVQLSKPHLASEFKTLSLDGLECQTKQFDSKLADRTSGFDDRLRWSIDVQHPSWGDNVKVIPQDSATLPFEFPPHATDAINVTYLDYDARAGQICERHANLRIVGEIHFDSVGLNVEIRQPDNDPVRKVENLVQEIEKVPVINLDLFKLLVQGRGKDNLSRSLMLRLNDKKHYDAMLNKFLAHDDFRANSYKKARQGIDDCDKKIIEIGPLGTNETRNNRTYTPAQKQSHYDEQVSKRMSHEEVLQNINIAFEEDYFYRVNGRPADDPQQPKEGEVARIVSSFKQADGRWLESFTVRLRELWAVAKDRNDKEYKIFFVKPDNNEKTGR